MTPYLIFVTVLTIAYIIYYGYHISKDLYGKKGETSDTAEVFDVASLQDEVTATPVREMDGGFSLGDNEVCRASPRLWCLPPEPISMIPFVRKWRRPTCRVREGSRPWRWKSPKRNTPSAEDVDLRSHPSTTVCFPTCGRLLHPYPDQPSAPVSFLVLQVIVIVHIRFPSR
jgi:hypothetical protein